MPDIITITIYDYPDFSKNLRDIIAQYGIKKSDIIVKTGISRNTIYIHLRLKDREISLANYYKIMQFIADTQQRDITVTIPYKRSVQK